MPNGDGTGPFANGRGGRGLGPCGKGRALGNAFRGRGRCWVSNPTAQATPEAGIYPYNEDGLEARKAEIEAELKWINEQMGNKDGR